MANRKITPFEAEMQQRFEALVTWALENWPDKTHPLAHSDFDKVRKDLATLAEGDADIGERNAEIPEPSENGPQYVNSNPAPWP
ncbi:MAG TPA: hypothetical protein VI140_11915 [Oxalicibacterium sp.]